LSSILITKTGSRLQLSCINESICSADRLVGCGSTGATSSSPPAPPRPFQAVCYQRLAPSVPQSCRCLQLLFPPLEPMQLSGQRMPGSPADLPHFGRPAARISDASSSSPPSRRSWPLSVALQPPKMLSILNECSHWFLENGHWTLQPETGHRVVHLRHDQMNGFISFQFWRLGTLSFMLSPLWRHYQPN
jgi:hypothetical protein